jgi:hypothetical protein
LGICTFAAWLAVTSAFISRGASAIIATPLVAVTTATATTLITTSAFALRWLLPARLRYDFLLVLVFLNAFHEVGDVQEGVALKSDLNERRLHARKHACDFTFVNGSREGVFVLAFEIDFYDLIIFDDGEFGLVGGRSDE